nr:hypothetical protein [Tanacetum cinerariifolium]
MKKLITDLLLLTPHREKETLYAYLVVSTETISAVLLTDRKGRKCPVQYVRRTLNEAEKNYAPMEKLVLALIHMTRRLRRYFEAHLVKVITDQPIKNVLNNTETSGKLAKYVVEIGAYNITFIPRNADLLAALRIARQMNISNIEVKVDSKLVASQINGSYEASKDNMIKYLAKAKEYASGFKSFSIKNIPRNMNHKADVLSKLASAAFNHLTMEVLVEVLNERSNEGQEIHTVVEEEGDNWMTPIRRCLKEGIWPKDKNEAQCLRANYVIQEIHMGSCGMHMGPLAVLRKAIRQWYYWPTTMHEDAKNEWGIDILGPLPPARGGAKFVIVAIDYFTKWIEAKPLVKITGKEVIRFVMDSLICMFGLPRVIVTDNGAQLVNDPFKSWCGRFEIHQMNTSVAHPRANGLVERANRSLMKGIKTSHGRAKAGWVDELANVLWAHRTSIKQSNREILFSLTYGSKAERREASAVREARYKTKMEQYYNKKVCPTGFRPREFVFQRNKASRTEDQGKLGPKWEGSYRVMEAYENGSYKLQTLKDKEVPRT